MIQETHEPCCAICGTHTVNALSNNADPFPGRCCHECDDRFVIPARLLGIEKLDERLALLMYVAKIGRQITLAKKMAQAHISIVKEIKP